MTKRAPVTLGVNLNHLSDITGRQVASCRGDRIGEGLRPGVYCLCPIGLRAGKAATAPVIKVAF